MNVNSRGHNLDTKKSQYFIEIKHPPGLKTRWVHPPPESSGHKMVTSSTRGLEILSAKRVCRDRPSGWVPEGLIRPYLKCAPILFFSTPTSTRYPGIPTGTTPGIPRPYPPSILFSPTPSVSPFSSYPSVVNRNIKQRVSNLLINVALSQHNLGDKG